MCSTVNPVENVFCSNCAARLVPLTGGPAADQRDSTPPIKGLSLPAKPAAPASTGSEEAEVPATKEKLEDWLDKLRESPPIEDEGTPLPTEKPLSTPTPPAPKELPKWVQEVDQAPTEQTPAVSNATEPSLAETELTPSETAEELPSWLKELNQETRSPGSTSPEKEALPMQSQASEEELPAWLRPATEERTVSGAPSPTKSEEERKQETQFQPSSHEPQTEEPEVIEPVRAEDIQSLIAKLRRAEAEPPELPQLPQTEVETSAGPVEPVRAEDIQSWIAKLKPAEAEPPAPFQPREAEREAIEPAKKEEIPSWISGLEPTKDQSAAPTLEAEAKPEPIEPARAEEIPPWIAELRPTEDQSTAQTQELEAEVRTEDLAEWLRSPIPEPRPQTVPQEPVGEPAEAAGPLADLRGVLPLAAAVTELHRIAGTAPPERKDGAHLFEEILAEQEQVTRAARRRVRRGLLTMRPAIYFALAFAIILALFVPPGISGSLLQISDTPAAKFYDAIQLLPKNATVIVSFDYDPSLSGEMDLVSLAILRHLIQRRINIIALSTLEPGPLIAQRVLTTATAGTSDYRYGVNFLNAGLVAGHESGVAQLAAQGLGANTRDFDQNQVIGQYPIAASVKNIKSVPMLIELAGGEATLRTWIEQFGTRTNVRIATGASAAVEPKARAYLDAGQLVALVTGPVGAAQYEILSNQQGQAVRQATAQSFGQIVLIMVVFAGNVVLWISRILEKK